MKKVTARRVRELLSYDKDTGLFTWRASRKGVKRASGLRAGTTNKLGYVYVTIDRVMYLGHRLAWLYVKGRWPSEIDHKNGNPSDNRFANLRIATHCQNMQNAKKRRAGLKGVVWAPERGKWTAAITANRKFIHLGYFPTELSAHEAYQKAAMKLHGEFARFE
jgi:hypothetical protein